MKTPDMRCWHVELALCEKFEKAVESLGWTATVVEETELGRLYDVPECVDLDDWTRLRRASEAGRQVF